MDDKALSKTLDFGIWFKEQPRNTQREIVTALGQLIKPQPAILKVRATADEFSRVFIYCDKYKIPKKFSRKGNKIHFTFRDLETRNQVLVGMRTL